MSDAWFGRRRLLGAAACLLPCLPAGVLAAEPLHIGAAHGTIDFAIGDFRLFRTTGSFKDWQGTVVVDDSEVPRSIVAVKVNTTSVEMLDPQQTAMLEGCRLLRRRPVPRDDLRLPAHRAHR